MSAETIVIEQLVELVGWLLKFRGRPDSGTAKLRHVQLPSLHQLRHRHEWPEEPSTEWGYRLAIRMLGVSLHAIGGMDGLHRGYEAVERHHGGKGAAAINSIWNGVGAWVS